MKSTTFQTITNNHGFKIDILENGLIQKIENKHIRLSLKPETIFGDGGFQLFLRKLDTTIRYKPITGFESDFFINTGDGCYSSKGTFENVDYELTISISDKTDALKCGVRIVSKNETDAQFDLIIRQDVGLKTVNDGLVNEYYVSQYLERRIFDDANYGKVICCRQNIKEKTGHPWMMMFCGDGAIAGSTDGRLFYGTKYRESKVSDALINMVLGGEYASESPVVALQSNPFSLKAGEMQSVDFYLFMLSDHPQASSEADLMRIPEIVKSFVDIKGIKTGETCYRGRKNIFNTAILQSNDLTSSEIDELFVGEKRQQEYHNDREISFFYGQSKHVVLRTKELLVDRPHGHIIQAQAGLQADENILSTTCYASGVFNSHLVQGNTNFNVLLSINTTQFNQNPEQGQRVFVEIDGQFMLLGLPSAFEMGVNFCRWIYKTDKHLIQVRTWTSKDSATVYTDAKVLKGSNIRFVATFDLDPLNNWSVLPSADSKEFVFLPSADSMTMDKFTNARYRLILPQNQYVEALKSGIEGQNMYENSGLLGLKTELTDKFELLFIGELKEQFQVNVPQSFDNQFLKDESQAVQLIYSLLNELEIESKNPDIEAIKEILPWFGLNALTHFLTPHGLEQFGGAAWGTRDVSQGPFDLLLSMGKYEEARKLLLTIFSNQHAHGGWPQWWMFDSYSKIRANEAHGDIYYWVIIATAQYVSVTGDLTVFEEVLPYFSEGTDNQQHTSLKEHLDRLINMIIDSFIPETCLVPFGGGDWNDSLQPVSQDLAMRLISSWTVQMNYQAFREITEVYRKLEDWSMTRNLESVTERIKQDFNKHLVKDGVVAGYGLVESDGSISVLLHPTDSLTGISYSLLPMDRGVLSGIFNSQQAKNHQQLIENHLKGPDGARLMDRPLKYKGGIQEIFQRAESSTFFGREIGIMYVHEHIRYAESQAVTGNADAFVKALRQANPVAYQDVVKMGDLRQSNCYYSSSDVAFSNRYAADHHYQDVLDGKMTLRGGWRVYSSGPGIYIGLVVQRLFGIRRTHEHLIIDPVMPFNFNGLEVKMRLLEHLVLFRYHIVNRNFSPAKICLNGIELGFTVGENPYRTGGAVLLATSIRKMLKESENQFDIWL